MIAFLVILVKMEALVGEMNDRALTAEMDVASYGLFLWKKGELLRDLNIFAIGAGSTFRG